MVTQMSETDTHSDKGKYGLEQIVTVSVLTITHYNIMFKRFNIQ